uniref:Ninja-family protein n=1 Tax=Musa acuminata subsp. malaccensis TaxID=214687 RepID=A0A804IPP0_MUSAM|nr:PREDICTED: ninja-family protein 6-like [Musa acuminata subsp. malaccensis]
MEGEAAKGGTERLLLGMERSARDFLRRFVGNGYGDETTEVTEGDSDEIELSLGLSLGGCFGADPKGKKLVRSSSIASFTSLPWEPEFPVVPAAALTRTSSLPTETEEERRKRKEMQSFKRLEAKRKRLERRNSIRSGAAKAGEKPDEEVTGSMATAAADHVAGARNGVTPPGLPAWTVGGSKRAAARPVDVPGNFPPISHGSLGSQGSSTAGACALGNRAPQGFGMTETKNSSMIHSAGNETSTKQVAVRANGIKEMERKMMEKMPFVSTRGDGPNGRRIEGFLYKYRKGEEVRIVCVCHGSFLTPAEFVKHAGGHDVTNPLRHIVVNSSPFSLL